MDWTNAVKYCATNINLSSYGGANDWRLPNWKELHSLIDARYGSPALCNTAGTAQWTEGNPFVDVVSSYYWSSTTSAANTGSAWSVSLGGGQVSADIKPTGRYMWPVRGGQ